jgi:signal transduction histidine kinase
VPYVRCMEQTQRWGPPWRPDRRTGRFAGPPGPGAFRGRGPGLGAAILTGFLQVVGANNLAGDGGVFVELNFWWYALLLIGPVALIVRRRFPLTVFLVAAAASLAFATVAQPTWTYAAAPGAALFHLAKKGRPVAAIVGGGTAYVVYVLLCGMFADHLGLAAGAHANLRSLLLLAVAGAVLIFLGSAAKARSEHFAEMVKVRAERERAKEEQERRQASEERLRIARELHDVLGHHLSLINVQAGVGLHLMDNRPEQAREALTAIKTASAEALREVRNVLGVLRTEGEAAPRRPALGLSRLEDLTADAGLPVTTKVTGDARELPPEVDRAAYRIVQEALTNVRRHAGPQATASIAVDYLPTALHLAIRNDGPAVRHDESGEKDGGSGIGGMRARAESLGGTLEAGPVDGGFLVSVLLPVAAEEDE